MSRYDDYYFPPYVSVAEKKERNAKMAAKLSQNGKVLKPVVLKNRTIASTFWGKAWCNNIESYQDYENRLPRGRSYVRSGAVLDLQITEGKVTALVAGSASTPYKITIDIQVLPAEKWEALKKKCVGKISSLLALIQGKLPPEILQEFCSKETGLFPAPEEIKMRCSCPDYADLCKHIAAVLYGIGARLDEDPSLFFTLRKIDGSELIGSDAASALTDGLESEIAGEDLENVFGVTFDELPEPAPAVKREKKPAKKTQLKKVPVVNFCDTAAKSGKAGFRRDREKHWIDSSSWLREAGTAGNAPARDFRGTKKGTAELLPAASGKKPTKWTGKKLIRLRKKLGISPADVAKHLGISVQTVSNWEKGMYEIKPKYFEKLNQLV